MQMWTGFDLLWQMFVIIFYFLFSQFKMSIVCPGATFTENPKGKELNAVC